MLSPSHRKRRWTESIDMRPVISVIVTEWRRGLKNCNRGEGNKHVLREYASLARNFLRNKAKMCFSFNLSFRSKPGRGCEEPFPAPGWAVRLNRAYRND